MQFYVGLVYSKKFGWFELDFTHRNECLYKTVRTVLPGSKYLVILSKL